MSQYINEFNEVCHSNSNDTRTRREATDLELEQAKAILDLEQKIESLQQEIEDLKTERQISYRSPRDLHDRS